MKEEYTPKRMEKTLGGLKDASMINLHDKMGGNPRLVTHDPDYPDLGDARVRELIDKAIEIVGLSKPEPHYMIVPIVDHWLHAPILPSIGDAWLNGAPIDYKVGDIPIDALEYLKTRRAGHTESLAEQLQWAKQVKAATAKMAEKRDASPASKPNWRKDRMAFLNGLNKRKY